MGDFSILAIRIKELRKSSNLTQQELGKLLNVTKVSVCCYENGTRTPSLDTLIDLSNIFHTSLDYFVGNDTFVISDDDEKYGIMMAKEEIEIIKELRQATNSDLYRKLISEPKRTIELINKKRYVEK